MSCSPTEIISCDGGFGIAPPARNTLPLQRALLLPLLPLLIPLRSLAVCYRTGEELSALPTQLSPSTRLPDAAFPRLASRKCGGRGVGLASYSQNSSSLKDPADPAENAILVPRNDLFIPPCTFFPLLIPIEFVTTKCPQRWVTECQDYSNRPLFCTPTLFDIDTSRDIAFFKTLVRKE